MCRLILMRCMTTYPYAVRIGLSIHSVMHIGLSLSNAYQYNITLILTQCMPTYPCAMHIDLSLCDAYRMQIDIRHIVCVAGSSNVALTVCLAVILPVVALVVLGILLALLVQKRRRTYKLKKLLAVNYHRSSTVSALGVCANQ